MSQGPVDPAAEQEPAPARQRSVAAATQRLQEAALSGTTSLLTLPLRTFRRFGVINGKVKALALAGQAFTSIIPLLILIASIGSKAENDRASRLIVHKFHLTGPSAEAVRTLFTRPPGATGAVSAVSIVLLLYATLTLTKSLQATYEEAWGLPSARGMKATMNGLSGMGLLVAQLIVLAVLVSALRGVPAGSFINLVIRLISSFVCWLVLQRLLLSGRVEWRRLVGSALVATGGQVLVSLISAVYMPHIISRDAGRYGVIGVTLALLSWLIIVCTFIVLAAVLGAEIGRAPLVNPDPTQRKKLLARMGPVPTAAAGSGSAEGPPAEGEANAASTGAPPSGTKGAGQRHPPPASGAEITPAG